MSIDSIITILGLLLAGLAIIPDSKRLIFQLRITFIDKVIGGLFFILIVYLLYYDSFKIYNYVPHFGFYRFGITPSNIIFILLFIFSVAAYFRFKFIKYFPTSNVKNFGKLVDNLLQEKKYNDLINIFDEYFEKISIKAFGKEYYREHDERYTSNHLLAQEIISKILLNEPFIDYLASCHSYAFIKYFDLAHYYRRFVYNLILSLLKNKNSILYHELKNIPLHLGDYEYVISENTKFLHFLQKDIYIVYKYDIGKAINDYALLSISSSKDINPHSNLSVVSNLNENVKYEYDLYIIILLYDIIINKSIYQKSECKNIYPYIDILVYLLEIRKYNFPEKNEFKLYYESDDIYLFFLDDLLQRMMSWINSVKYSLQRSGIQISITEIERHTISKSIAYIISSSISGILLSEFIPRSFKVQVCEKIFDNYINSMKQDDELYMYISNIILRKYINNQNKKVRDSYYLFIIDVIEKDLAEVHQRLNIQNKFKTIITEAKAMLEPADKRN